MKLTLSEQYYLKFAKIFLLGLVIIFLVSPGKTKFWPFIYWELYDKGNPKIPQTMSRIELRILDSNQNWHSVEVKDLYSIDDDSSSQPGGRKIIQNTFMRDPENWSIYRPYLIKHLKQKFNFKIDKIEAYKLTWKLDYKQYPPLDINQPTKMEKIDSFQISDYIN